VAASAQARQVAGGAVEVEQPDAFGEVQIDVGEVGFEGPQDGDRVAVVADVDPPPDIVGAQPGAADRRRLQAGNTAFGRASEVTRGWPEDLPSARDERGAPSSIALTCARRPPRHQRAVS
jgi:hypothetical protein